MKLSVLCQNDKSVFLKCTVGVSAGPPGLVHGEEWAGGEAGVA